MISVVFIEPDGQRKDVLAVEGSTLMQTATANGIAGILALCGGNAACGTCHVYLDSRFVKLIPPAEALEDQMLDATASERRGGSRLACQVIVTQVLSGMEITCPSTQD